MPDGWLVDPAQLIENWYGFAEQIRIHDDNETVLVVTSNGVARFAPHITVDFESFRAGHDIKISTGALCIFVYEDSRWVIKGWNIKP